MLILLLIYFYHFPRSLSPFLLLHCYSTRLTPYKFEKDLELSSWLFSLNTEHTHSSLIKEVKGA